MAVLPMTIPSRLDADHLVSPAHVDPRQLQGALAVQIERAHVNRQRRLHPLEDRLGEELGELGSEALKLAPIELGE